MSEPTPALVASVHTDLPLPAGVTTATASMVRGDYLYFHYLCDGTDDRGWGCGYRTLQTICSWVKTQQQQSGRHAAEVPSLAAIQRRLVDIGDKESNFCGSKSWIGSVEVGLVVDTLYDVPCKILHVPNGEALPRFMEQLSQHFLVTGAPVMMGGDSDAASKGILGVVGDLPDVYILILDPHYVGPTPCQRTLVDKGMLVWRHVDSFMKDSFYNLCLPQYKG